MNTSQNGLGTPSHDVVTDASAASEALDLIAEIDPTTDQQPSPNSETSSEEPSASSDDPNDSSGSGPTTEVLFRSLVASWNVVVPKFVPELQLDQRDEDALFEAWQPILDEHGLEVSPEIAATIVTISVFTPKVIEFDRRRKRERTIDIDPTNLDGMEYGSGEEAQ